MTSNVTARRDSRADEARQKIRKVGDLIRLSRKIKSSSGDAVLGRLDKAAAELDSGKGVPLARIREKIRGWAGK
jgi:hypothetical protein